VANADDEGRPPALVPQPLRVRRTPGGFVVGPRPGIWWAPGAEEVGRYLLGAFSHVHGLAPRPVLTAHEAQVRLVMGEAPGAGAEGYRLAVTPGGITVAAEAPAGLFYGCQVLRQLSLAPEAGAPAGVFALPCVEIEDRARFRWRGAMLDVARHFMPKAWLLRYIDLLALHRFNVLHLHLTDDQGWRLEIERYPLLTEVGSQRDDTMLRSNPPAYAGEPYKGFYTRAEMADVVAYAAERFITVVPEIETPGHASAAIAAYPELGNSGRPIAVSTRWGIHHEIFNTGPSTIRFLCDVLDEVLALFPSPWVHAGGDEAPKEQWQESHTAQRQIRALGLNDEAALQTWFLGEVGAYLAARGRRLVGWDEILEGGLPPGATVMSWRGEAGGIAAARLGHDAVMTPMRHTYFDHYQSRDRANEPHAIGGHLPLERVYGYEPVPAEIRGTAAEEHVLGTQFQLWTEYIRTPAHAEYMAFPRACALAEVAWDTSGRKDWAAFRGRLAEHLQRLDVLAVNYRRLDP
jgi:hexosaminidase